MYSRIENGCGLFKICGKTIKRLTRTLCKWLFPFFCRKNTKTAMDFPLSIYCSLLTGQKKYKKLLLLYNYNRIINNEPLGIAKRYVHID